MKLHPWRVFDNCPRASKTTVAVLVVVMVMVVKWPEDGGHGVRRARSDRTDKDETCTT